MSSAIYTSSLSTATDIDATGAAAETDTEIVAASTGLKVKVAYVFYMCDTATLVTFKSDGSSTIFLLTPAANGGANVLAPEGTFLFESVAGESLTYTTDTAGKHIVHVAYTQSA